MKITNITAHIMGVPGPGGHSPSRNWIFVRVDTDEGITGVGEATTEWQEYAVVAMVERHMAPLLAGQDPTQINSIWQQMQRGFRWRGGVIATSAASGIDQALWDIAGKAYNQPVYRLLGGACRNRVKVYARSDLGLASHAEELRQAMSEGFTAFKFSPAVEYRRTFDEERQVDIALDLAGELRVVAGPHFDLMIDCGGIFSLQAAHRLIAGLRPLKLLFVEEPVGVDTPHSLIALRRAFPDVHIAAGEQIVTRWGFREWLEDEAVDIIQADLSHCGGISELMRISSCAEVYGVQMAPHNPYGPVAMAANLHACAAMQNFLILEHCRLRPSYEKVQISGPKLGEGYVYLNEQPGLGIELDWDLIERSPFHPIPMRLRFGADGGLICS